MKQLYLKPISNTRFKEYLTKLQGDTKGDLALPISGFNPMAKDHIITKISELENLGAEDLINETIQTANAHFDKPHSDEVLVVLNIADDLKGKWTNYYTTDFDSKFKLNALVTRNYCVPYFWTSEAYSVELIKSRTMEYLSRTAYRLNNKQPKTLQEHLSQEVFVATQIDEKRKQLGPSERENLEAYYEEHKYSDDYQVIFNFFYGDKGSDSLGYKKLGIGRLNGYDYAKSLNRTTI